MSAIGEGVTGFEVGDRVAWAGVPCGHCEDCLKDIITSAGLCGYGHSGEKDGYSCISAHAASMTFKLPDNVSTMEGGLMEPLWVCTACELSNVKLGETQWC